MKVLLDENVSRGLALWLTDRGFTVFVVGKDLESGCTDQDVFGFAVSKRAILITRDNDFTNPVRFRVERTAGVIYIHPGNLPSAAEITLVARFLDRHSLDKFRGKLVTLYMKETRIR